jgi:hypothetical protein
MNFTSEVPYIAEFHTQTIISLLYIVCLEHNPVLKFRLVSSMVLFYKFRLFVCEKERS